MKTGPFFSKLFALKLVCNESCLVQKRFHFHMFQVLLKKSQERKHTLDIFLARGNLCSNGQRYILAVVKMMEFSFCCRYHIVLHFAFHFLFLLGPENFDSLVNVLGLAQFLLPLTQFLNLRITANLKTFFLLRLVKQASHSGKQNRKDESFQIFFGRTCFWVDCFRFILRTGCM